MPTCGKCQNKFHSIYAGDRDAFFEFILELMDYAIVEGYTDRETLYFVKNHINSIKRKFKDQKQLRSVLDKFLD